MRWILLNVLPLVIVFVAVLVNDYEYRLKDSRLPIATGSQIAECLHHYFINITDSLPIEPYVTMPFYVTLRNPTVDAIRKYENHSSVVLIKNNLPYTQTFELQPISCVDIVHEINNLDRSKITRVHFQLTL